MIRLPSIASTPEVLFSCRMPSLTVKVPVSELDAVPASWMRAQADLVDGERRADGAVERQAAGVGAERACAADGDGGGAGAPGARAADVFDGPGPFARAEDTADKANAVERERQVADREIALQLQGRRRWRR